MKFRNQLAVNLVKLLAPVHSYPSSEIDPVEHAFSLADRTVARIQHDIDIEHQKAAYQSLAEIHAYKAAASAEASQAEASVNRRFFAITDQGLVAPRPDETFEDFMRRILAEFEGK